MTRRLYADNNVPRAVIDHLRRAGMDVLWIAEDPKLRSEQDDGFHYSRARQLRRYLLTADTGFWDDQHYPVKDSPGLILLTTKDTSTAKYLPQLLRKLLREYGPEEEPLDLDGVKIRVTSGGFTIKMDQEIQKTTTQSWQWREVV